MDGERTRRPIRFKFDGSGSLNFTKLNSVAFPQVYIFSLLGVLISCAGCALRFETAGGNAWSMGLSRHTVKLQSLDHETSLAKENSENAPFELAIVPFGIEASLGRCQQARGFVLPNDITNRFLAPKGLGLGSMKGWYFGFVHYRIPRESNRVRLMANTVKGGALRFATPDPYLKLGLSKTTLITVLAEPASGHVDFKLSASAPDFDYSLSPTAPP